jgi:hypothetical protein
MKNFINESWVAALVLILLIAAGYGFMHLFLYFGGY